MSEYYSPEQLEVIRPFLPKEPKWLVLAGPADANEAQTARRLWPSIKVLGIEPNSEAWRWQCRNGWPNDCLLLQMALGSADGKAKMVRESGILRNASLDPHALVENVGRPEAKTMDVHVTTLDMLDLTFGPFEDAVVWMDIEGSELEALKGASKLIASGRVLLWNIEMMNRVPGLMEGIPELLVGYRQVHEWNASDTCRDRIYVKS